MAVRSNRLSTAAPEIITRFIGNDMSNTPLLISLLPAIKETNVSDLRFNLIADKNSRQADLIFGSAGSGRQRSHSSGVPSRSPTVREGYGISKDSFIEASALPYSRASAWLHFQAVRPVP